MYSTANDAQAVLSNNKTVVFLSNPERFKSASEGVIHFQKFLYWL